MDAKLESPEEIDFSYSPVPEEGRSRNEGGAVPKTVLVIGALGRATDPTGAPGNRFQFFLHIRQALQGMGLRLSWVNLAYDRKGRISASDVRAFELQAAALGESLAGVLLLDPGYGRELALWQLAADSVRCPVLWFHTSPLDDEQPAHLPRHCHILEPDWDLAGRVLSDHLTSQYHPQQVLLLPGPGEPHLHHHLECIRIGLSETWGNRWVDILNWESVFPKPMEPRRPNVLERVMHLALQDTGLRPYDLDVFFDAALSTRADLWVCADDLLALAALEHLDRRKAAVRPGVIGFGNHPFALQRGLCTVELGWSSLTEAAVEKFTGMGRRARTARAFVIPGPSGTPTGEHPLSSLGR
jgi:hypothetical protein